MKGLFFCILLFVSSVALAQWDGLARNAPVREPDTVWIITGKHVLGPAYRRLKLDFSLDARQTLIGSQAARVGGVRIGLEYRRVHRMGVGLYGVGDGVTLSNLAEIDSSITWARLNLSYQSLYYERVMYFSRKLEWSITAHYGRGRVKGTFVRLGESNLQTLPEQRVGVLEFSTLGYYNLNYWCSVGLGVGYRYMLSTPEDIRSVYEAPVGLLRVRFKLGKLVKSIWDKDTKNLY